MDVSTILRFRFTLVLLVSQLSELRCEWVELPQLKPTLASDVSRHSDSEIFRVSDEPSSEIVNRYKTNPEQKSHHDAHHDYSNFVKEKGDQWQQLLLTESSTSVSPTPTPMEPLEDDETFENTKCRNSLKNKYGGSFAKSTCGDGNTTIEMHQEQPNIIVLDSVKPSISSLFENNQLTESYQVSQGTKEPAISKVENENKTSQQHKQGTFTHLDPMLESIVLHVHQTLVSHAEQPLSRKVHYLKSLQNSMLNQIWRKSHQLWVPRHQVEEGRGHDHDSMSIPSLEGALLTISFLTFAVFLIKCVKQFIQGMQGTNVTMVEVTGNRVRARRQALGEQAARIMQLIEEFQLHHAPS